MSLPDPSPTVRAFVLPAPRFDERSTLADVSAELAAGRPAVLGHQGRWFLLTPEAAIGWPPTRRLIDLPLVEVEGASPDLPAPLAFLSPGSARLDQIPVVEGGALLGLVSCRTVLEHYLAEAQEASRLGRFLAESLAFGRTLVWSVPVREGGAIEVESPFARAHGPFEPVLGYRPEELALWLPAAIHPEDRPEFDRTTNALLAGAGSGRETRTYRVRSREGRWVWLQEEAWAEADGTGRVRSLTAVATDTSAIHKRLERALLAIPNGVVVLDEDRRILLANPPGRDFLQALCPGRDCSPSERLACGTIDELLRGASGEHPIEIAPGDGRIFDVAASSHSAERRSETVLLVRDVTREREQARRAAQQDRLAALGQLAGGVAHDFNNLLTAIMGYQALLLRSLPESDPRLRDVQGIGGAAVRAAELTSQLLAFSRQQPTRPRPLDLNVVVAGMREMLRRVIEERVELETRLSSDPCWIEADPEQIERVLMNLAINGSDAMVTGGRLTIATTTVLDGGSHPVTLEVRDTGSGIAPDVLARIFEPFFTTKERGRGTGLGLSTVHGIAEQNAWRLEVESRIGRGSTFRLRLPRLGRTPPAESPPASEVRDLPCGHETILVVEDEEFVRDLVRVTLEKCGYRVIHAPDGLECLELLDRVSGGVDLILTDLVMPRLDGRELAARLRSGRPAIPILFMTGHAPESLLPVPSAGRGDLLLKPFRPEELARKVRETLDRPIAPVIVASEGKREL